jgi:hypothetical protein
LLARIDVKQGCVLAVRKAKGSQGREELSISAGCLISAAPVIAAVPESKTSGPKLTSGRQTS